MCQKIVSVIIPVYNCEAYIKQCIDSLLIQTYKDIEIILVDDGSTDKSPEMCDAYAEKYNNIHVFHQSNSGAASARKNGIEQACGDYFLFVDADDWVEVNFVQDLISTALKHNTDVTIGSLRLFPSNQNKVIKQHLPSGCYSRSQLEEHIFPVMLSAPPYFTFGITPNMCGKLFKKEIVNYAKNALNTGLWFGEDGCFTYSALLDCTSIYITDNAGYIYRQNNSSVTQRFNPRLLTEGPRLRSFLEHLAAKKNWVIGSQLDEYMANICCNVVISALKSSCARNSNQRHLLADYVDATFPTKKLKLFHDKTTSAKDKWKLFLIRRHLFISLSLLIRINNIIKR